MIDAPVAYAFGVGMVATFNPCGFAMLPAYVSYFLGLESSRPTTDDPPQANVLRALAVGVAMTAGFLVVFGLLGIVLDPVLDAVQERLPWLTILLGAVLAGLGVALLAGRTVSLNLLKMARGADRQELWSVFLFGISYALVSLSCTLPTFLAAVAGVFDTANAASGIAVFLAYGLGMGLVLMVLTLATALARQGMVRRMRSFLPYVNRVSGALLLLAGVYVAYYGWYELRIRSGATGGGAVAGFVFDLNARISNWIQQVGPVRIGLLLALAIAATVTAALARRSRVDQGS
ncbi:cytochrome c biogenesis CcdA family protein [Rhabdothermincola sediminis]|uniref:cytochrome c biogenesis CcdA family protein n=1 Tax=Rhabdothermincola sediminis TaxID=2751370 RepID=UPI001AA00EB9|nr:cytochrome c biogenesis CcdA family protein [Rhabdothermincola sediminis]